MARQFRFDGGAFDFLIVRVISYLLTFFTLGLAYPWALCIMATWRAEHTLIAGRRLRFNGSGIGLFVNYIKWWFFTVITFGIYSFWLIPALYRWEIENTSFAD